MARGRGSGAPGGGGGEWEDAGNVESCVCCNRVWCGSSSCGTYCGISWELFHLVAILRGQFYCKCDSTVRVVDCVKSIPALEGNKEKIF